MTVTLTLRLIVATTGAEIPTLETAPQSSTHRLGVLLAIVARPSWRIFRVRRTRQLFRPRGGKFVVDGIHSDRFLRLVLALVQTAADEFQQLIRWEGFLKEIFAAAQLELPSGDFGAVPAGEDHVEARIVLL